MEIAIKLQCLKKCFKNSRTTAIASHVPSLQFELYFQGSFGSFFSFAWLWQDLLPRNNQFESILFTTFKLNLKNVGLTFIQSYCLYVIYSRILQWKENCIVTISIVTTTIYIYNQTHIQGTTCFVPLVWVPHTTLLWVKSVKYKWNSLWPPCGYSIDNSHNGNLTLQVFHCFSHRGERWIQILNQIIYPLTSETLQCRIKFSIPLLLFLTPSYLLHSLSACL